MKMRYRVLVMLFLMVILVSFVYAVSEVRTLRRGLDDKVDNKPLRLTDVDKRDERCRVNLHGKEDWIRLGEVKELEDYFVSVLKVKDKYNCIIQIKSLRGMLKPEREDYKREFAKDFERVPMCGDDSCEQLEEARDSRYYCPQDCERKIRCPNKCQSMYEKCLSQDQYSENECGIMKEDCLTRCSFEEGVPRCANSCPHPGEKRCLSIGESSGGMMCTRDLRLVPVAEIGGFCESDAECASGRCAFRRCAERRQRTPAAETFLRFLRSIFS